jgi:hypothetical protein
MVDVSQTRPFWSSIGLWTLVWLFHMISLPYADG